VLVDPFVSSMAKDKDKEGEKPRNKLTKVRLFVSLVEMGLFVLSGWGRNCRRGRGVLGGRVVVVMCLELLQGMLHWII
jgi:hypothetical protein